MIRSRNMAGVGRTITGSFWTLFTNPVTIATYHVSTANNLNGILAGGTPTSFAAFFTKQVQSLFFTPSISSGTATAAVFKIVGENQFGETVTEFLALTGTTASQTVLCYRRVTALTVFSITGAAFGATDSVTVGYSHVAPRIPMLAKLVAPSTVMAVKNINQTSDAAQPVPRAVTVGALVSAQELAGMEIYNILLATNAVVGATGGPAVHTVYLNSEDSQL